MAHTMLLGLGGTGSRVVAKVAKELEKNNIAINDGAVCCAVMDTDRNDMENLLKVVGVETPIPVVATSSANTVGDVLRMHPEASEWCIHDVDVYKGETMTNGASTMRMKSRLAFLNTYNGMKIRTIEELVSRMMTKGDGQDSIQVMLVSSISGGTGAGMFLQTALWIRNVFKERGKEIKLRGMLILPDIFVKTVKDVSNNDFLEDRHYANAYAAIREMNAVSKIKLEPGYKPKVPMKIDDLFDSEDLNNPRRSPKGLFDFIFFIDYENKTGANLNSISAYEDVVAQLTYLQLYSPMKDSINTKEDNIFLNNVRQGFSFGSCGTAKAVYPKDDVMEYCVLRTVSEMISDGWLNLDSEVESIKMEEKSRRNAGEVVEPTNPVENYMLLCEDKINKNSTAGAKDPFFASLRDEATEVKVKEFMKKLDSYMKSKVDNANNNQKGLSKLNSLGEKLGGEMEPAKGEQGENQDSGTKFEVQSAQTSVRDSEDAKSDLETYDVETLKGAITSNAALFGMEIKSFNNIKCAEISNSITNDVFPRIVSELDMNNDKSVYGMLTNFDEASGTRNFVHPVAMRYLLYKLQKFLANEKNNKNKELKIAVGKLNRLDAEVSFNYERTKNTEETLYTYFDKKPRFFEGGEAPYRQFFINQYRLYVKKQYTYGKEYELKSVQAKVLQELYNRVTILIKNIEDFFKQLPKITEECQEGLQKNLQKTLKSTNITYVCASEKAKKYIYDSLDMRFDGSDKLTNKLVIDAAYGMLCAEAIPGHKDNEKYVDFDIKEAFNEGVRDYYTKTIMETQMDKIDLDIYGALKAQMHGEGRKDYDSEMATLVATIEHNAEPYMQYVVDEKEQITYKFWAFHPSLAKAYPELGSAIGGNAQTQANAAFPKNEFSCYSTVYNVDVPHFHKFSEDANSDYYREYSEIVYKMNDTQSRTLMQTPHLDKTWHNVLPYLTDKKQAEEDRRLYRGILYGFAYNRLRLDNNVYQILRNETDWMTFREGEDLVRKPEVADLIRMLLKDGTFIHHDTVRLEKEFAKETLELDNYVGTKIYQYFMSPDDTNPIKLLCAYNNCRDCNSEIKNGIIKAMEDILLDLIDAYDKNHHDINRSEDNKEKAKLEHLKKIYENCECKGKENVFISWLNNFN